MRSLLGTKRVGHTGTLDPDATGILPICVGKATKLAQYLLTSDKEYHVIMQLGETTDTQDASGRRTGGLPTAGLEPEIIQATLMSFVGKCRQIPPMYSAVKIGGVPLYRLARKGEEVERKPREIEIHAIRSVVVEGDFVTFEVACSKGTYIRTLCADVGERLGVGGRLHQLTRLRTGPFVLQDAISLEEVKAFQDEGTLSQRLIPIARMVDGLAEVSIRAEAVERILCGGAVVKSAIRNLSGVFRPGDKVRLTDPSGRLLGIGVALTAAAEALQSREQERIVKSDRILL
jgi:tRNA pseudouridine55 synthase